MSARERFFKKIQQNKQPVPAGDNPVAAEIAQFCRQMDALAQQIAQWLDGSGIEVSIATKYLNDLSTIGTSLNSGASHYEIATIRLLNENRSVSVMPEQFYQDGDKGCVTIILDTPDRVPDRQRFYLHMAPEGGWLVRAKYQGEQGSVMLLTEDVYIQVIEHLD